VAIYLTLVTWAGMIYKQPGESDALNSKLENKEIYIQLELELEVLELYIVIIKQLDIRRKERSRP
jgi:hypothetical protein